jgi:hypothetical protein
LYQDGPRDSASVYWIEWVERPPLLDSLAVKQGAQLEHAKVEAIL